MDILCERKTVMKMKFMRKYIINLRYIHFLRSKFHYFFHCNFDSLTSLPILFEENYSKLQRLEKYSDEFLNLQKKIE